MENNEIQVNTTLFDAQEPERKQGRVASWLERSAGRPIRTRDKVVGGILIVVFLFVFYVMLDANKYAATAHVIEGEGKVGVNPTTERLDFGDLSRGTSSVRRVTIKNGTVMPMYVVMVKTGSVGDLMDIDKNYFKLKPGAEERVEFTVYMPASAQIDSTHDGRVYLFKIPTFGI